MKTLFTADELEDLSLPIRPGGASMLERLIRQAQNNIQYLATYRNNVGRRISGGEVSIPLELIYKCRIYLRTHKRRGLYLANCMAILSAVDRTRHRHVSRLECPECRLSDECWCIADSSWGEAPVDVWRCYRCHRDFFAAAGGPYLTLAQSRTGVS